MPVDPLPPAPRRKVPPRTQKGKIPKRTDSTPEPVRLPNHDWQDDLVLLCHSFLNKSSDSSREDFGGNTLSDTDTDTEPSLSTEQDITTNAHDHEEIGPFGYPNAPPSPSKYTEYHAINDAIDNHCFNRNSRLDDERSITYRTFSKLGNSLPPHLQTDSKCHTILCALDTLNNRSTLRGLKHHQKVKVVHRALRTSANRLRSLENEAVRLAAELLIRAPNKPIDTNTENWGRYNLKELGLNNIKSNLKNAHLTSDAAFSAVNNTSRKLPTNFAVLDTGATKHFVPNN